MPAGGRSLGNYADPRPSEAKFTSYSAAAVSDATLAEMPTGHTTPLPLSTWGALRRPNAALRASFPFRAQAIDARCLVFHAATR